MDITSPATRSWRRPAPVVTIVARRQGRDAVVRVVGQPDGAGLGQLRDMTEWLTEAGAARVSVDVGRCRLDRESALWVRAFQRDVEAAASRVEGVPR